MHFTGAHFTATCALILMPCIHCQTYCVKEGPVLKRSGCLQGSSIGAHLQGRPGDEDLGDGGDVFSFDLDRKK